MKTKWTSVCGTYAMVFFKTNCNSVVTISVDVSRYVIRKVYFIPWTVSTDFPRMDFGNTMIRLIRRDPGPIIAIVRGK